MYTPSFYRPRSCLFTSVNRQEIIEVPRHVESRTPLDEANVVWVLSVSKHKTDAHGIFEIANIHRHLLVLGSRGAEEIIERISYPECYGPLRSVVNLTLP